ncbi:hypothetical protein Tco_0418639 [Tanacetum coccineum]
MALMAFSDSEVYNDKTCSNTCLKSFETLKSQHDSLRIKLNKSEFNLATYKRGLASVEEQLVFYKKNEVMFCDQIVVLKRDTSFKDSDFNALKCEIEKLKKEKECNQIKIDKFENDSKSLDKLIGSQVTDNHRKGMGYNVVPPPPTGLFAPPTIDLSYYGLEEFQQPKFEGYGPKANKIICLDTSNDVKKTPDTLIGLGVGAREKEANFNTVKGRVSTAKSKAVTRPNAAVVNAFRGNPPTDDQGYVDNGCSRHMTGNMHVKRGRDTKIPQSSGPPKKVGDEAVHKELGDRIERAATTASSFEAEQDSGNINRTQSMATLNKPSP